MMIALIGSLSFVFGGIIFLAMAYIYKNYHPEGWQRSNTENPCKNSSNPNAVILGFLMLPTIAIASEIKYLNDPQKKIIRRKHHLICAIG